MTDAAHKDKHLRQIICIMDPNALLLNADGNVKGATDLVPRRCLIGPLDIDDSFGTAVAAIGDLDGCFVPDALVGTCRDDNAVSDRGVVFVLLLIADGTIKAEQKISSIVDGLVEPSVAHCNFGISPPTDGDLVGDGLTDAVVGEWAGRRRCHEPWCCVCAPT